MFKLIAEHFSFPLWRGAVLRFFIRSKRKFMSSSLAKIPSGVQYIFDKEVRLRRFIEREVMSAFAGWSYAEIILPIFDYADLFALRMSKEQADVKPADVPVYVEYGVADAGVCGRDVLIESSADVHEPLDLRFGRCRLVVAGKAESAARGYNPLATARVATKR